MNRRRFLQTLAAVGFACAAGMQRVFPEPKEVADRLGFSRTIIKVFPVPEKVLPATIRFYRTWVDDYAIYHEPIIEDWMTRAS